jgi:hypothetical protein
MIFDYSLSENSVIEHLQYFDNLLIYNYHIFKQGLYACEISDLGSGEYEDDSFLGCCAV